MKRSLFIISFYLFISIYALGQDQKAGAILDAMSEKYKDMNSFAASFTYLAVSASGKQGRTRSGGIATKGIKFKLDMAGQEIFNNGTEIYAFVKETNEVNITEFDASEDSPFSPAKIYSIYKNGYNYSFNGTKTLNGKPYDVIELVPLEGGGNIKKLELTVHTQTRAIKKWRLWDGSGKQTVFDITQFNPNAALTDDFFNFDVAKYPGVEIVDLR